MKIIWYNTHSHTYQFGDFDEYKSLSSEKPTEILGLEKFRNASEKTLLKIVDELNKCQLSKQKISLDYK